MARRFLIYGFPYTEASGGVMTLYRLAENLKTIGERAEVVSLGHDAVHPIVRKPCPDDAIAIYPECFIDNPARARRVVRWVLNTPGTIGNGDGIFGNHDLIFLWSHAYHVDPHYRVAGLLSAYDFHLDFFVDQGGPRAGTCYVVRKGRGNWRRGMPAPAGWESNGNGPLHDHPTGSVSIEHYALFGGNEFLRAAFNRFEQFVSYDECTQLNVCAALCGCKSVVLPSPGLSAADWRERTGPHTRGIHYGLNDPAPSSYSHEQLRADLRAMMEEQSLDEARAMVRATEERWA